MQQEEEVQQSFDLKRFPQNQKHAENQDFHLNSVLEKLILSKSHTFACNLSLYTL